MDKFLKEFRELEGNLNSLRVSVIYIQEHLTKTHGEKLLSTKDNLLYCVNEILCDISFLYNKIEVAQILAEYIEREEGV